MDATLINPFLVSVQHVFRTMVGAEVQIGKPYVSNDAVSLAAVAGVTDLSGEMSE